MSEKQWSETFIEWRNSLTIWSITQIPTGVNDWIQIYAKRWSELSFTKIQEIYTFLQDIWWDPHSLWEYAQCSACKKILSKNDYFSKPYCCINQNLHLIYGEDYEAQLMERYYQKDSYCVICEVAWKIVWIMDCYIECPEYIIDKEFHHHYWKIPTDMLLTMIWNMFWVIPRRIISFSSMGFAYGHDTLFNVVRVLNSVANILRENSRNHLPGITEIDRNNHLAQIYSILWSRSLGITDSQMFWGLIENTAPHYRSDIVTFDNPVFSIERYFKWGLKSFLRQTKARR